MVERESDLRIHSFKYHVILSSRNTEKEQQTIPGSYIKVSQERAHLCGGDRMKRCSQDSKCGKGGAG